MKPPGGFKIFPTEHLAHLWVRRAIRERRFNYFVGFINASPRPDGTIHRSPAIMFGWAIWAGERPYVKDIFPHVVH